MSEWMFMRIDHAHNMKSYKQKLREHFSSVDKTKIREIEEQDDLLVYSKKYSFTLVSWPATIPTTFTVRYFSILVELITKTD